MLGHLIFDGYDFGELFYCHAEKPLMPTLAIQELSVAGADGARFAYRTANPVEVNATMFLRDPKQNHERMRAILDEVAEHLYPQQQKLYLPTFEDRYYVASVAGTSTVQEFVTSAKLVVTFRILDPFMYGTKRTKSITEESTVIRRGGNAPASFVFSGKPIPNSDYVRVRNGGSTWMPRVVMYRNKKNDETKWGGNESVVIDTGGRIATVNGNRWPVTLNSTFWQLDSERVVLYANGITGKLEWRETWL